MNNVHGIDEELLAELEKQIEHSKTFLELLSEGDIIESRDFGRGEMNIKSHFYMYDDIGKCIQKIVDQIFEDYGTTEIKFRSDDNLPNTTSTD